jgi:hypothetical protein
MPTNDTAVHAAAEVIHKWMGEFAPQIQTFLADVAEWDSDTLIRRYCLLRAHLRDTNIRLCGILPPPPKADLAWWRVNVADHADAWGLKLWTDPTALPRLLIETQDIRTVQALIWMPIGFFLVCREYDGRLEAQKISRTMRTFSYDPLAVRNSEQTGYAYLLKLIGDKRERKHLLKVIKRAKEAVYAETPSDGLVGLFNFLEQERLQGRNDADTYATLASGPLSSERCPTVQQWESIAGALLVEDIRRCEQDYRALLTPNLDVKAIGAAKGAARQQHRESLAEKRGGPGIVKGKIRWLCKCGIEHKRKVFHCLKCHMERPDSALHVSLDDESLQKKNRLEDIHQATPFENTLANQQIANIKAHLPEKILEAFRLIEDGASDEEAARAVGTTSRTLRNWRSKIRRQDKL